MGKSTFVYVIYIATRPEVVWKALLDGEFTRQYWGHENVSDWRPGSPWEHRRDDPARTVVLLGEVLEAEAPRRLVMTWAEPKDRGRRDRHSRVTFEIEPVADMVRLTVTHDELEAGSELQHKITQRWPRVLSSLKSLLETGRALPTWATAPGEGPAVPGAGETLEAFYAAVRKRDLAAARASLHPDLVFHGLFETYRSADEYLTALTGLLSITTRLEVRTIVAQGEDAAVFFDLETSAPAAATTLVAEWHRVRHGQIVEVRSAFDGRPFEKMFTR